MGSARVCRCDGRSEKYRRVVTEPQTFFLRRFPSMFMNIYKCVKEISGFAHQVA